jgi:1-acyl-sn-glycerol-3-phosphate acyltransferase
MFMQFFQLLRSILFTTLYFTLTTLIGVVVIASTVFPYRVRWAITHQWSRLIIWLLKVLCDLDLVVEGRENIPPGAHVTMWKHSSTWETIAQALVFPEQAWVMKRELLWIPVVGWSLAAMLPIAINRSAGGSAVKQVITQGKERLKAGRWIVIFPEGTRTAPGETRKYGISGALLAIEAGVSIVPVAHTAGYFWPRRGWIKKPGAIRLVIGKPMPTQGRDARELTSELQTWMDQTVAEIAPRD